ncbi:hypothetical protein [Hamadaea tsunoensis]|uniref:hypothetical protein n=1 Tax=Hamadaea tsunoensis TaxID=53368 RepID=UPI0004108E2C|nr:hypothetical protein [Hamadaea tsunoensis]
MDEIHASTRNQAAAIEAVLRDLPTDVREGDAGWRADEYAAATAVALTYLHRLRESLSTLRDR